MNDDHETCIIVAAAVPWDGPRHREHEVAARLAQRYCVVYLEPPSDPLKTFLRNRSREGRESYSEVTFCHRLDFRLEAIS